MSHHKKQHKQAKAQRKQQRKLAKKRKQAVKRRNRQAAIRERATIRAALATPAMHNQCGKCTACCTVIGVEELGKPHHRPCPHVTEDGCAIYDHRPPSCRGFGCLWLDTPGADESCRPDKLGIVFTLDSKPQPDGDALCLEVWEVREGAMKSKYVRELARHLERQLKVISATCWYPANTPVPVRYAIDPARWPEDVQYGNRFDPIRMERRGRDLFCRGDTAGIPALPIAKMAPGNISESSSPS